MLSSLLLRPVSQLASLLLMSSLDLLNVIVYGTAS